jgi:predicted nucleic acid-binding protein
VIVLERLYRACRVEARPPRKLTDRLIAAVAIRIGTELLARSPTSLPIARHAPLRIVAA